MPRTRPAWSLAPHRHASGPPIRPDRPPAKRSSGTATAVARKPGHSPARTLAELSRAPRRRPDIYSASLRGSACRASSTGMPSWPAAPDAFPSGRSRCRTTWTTPGAPPRHRGVQRWSWPGKKSPHRTRRPGNHPRAWLGTVRRFAVGVAVPGTSPSSQRRSSGGQPTQGLSFGTCRARGPWHCASPRCRRSALRCTAPEVAPCPPLIRPPLIQVLEGMGHPVAPRPTPSDVLHREYG